MRLTQEQVDEMNNVQKRLMGLFIDICDKLNLKYYMVHGSLLGTIKYGDFFPLDDDIDVAMPRQDYDRLLESGQAILPDNIILQSCKTEKEFPLAFAKLRDSNTTFIQTMMKGLNINQGIYIDIFPMDYYPKEQIRRKWLFLWSEIYKARIGTRINYETSDPVWKKVLRGVSCVICPSWEAAVQKRADLYATISKTNEFIMVGGKDKERGIPIKWFGEGVSRNFAGLSVCCPKMYEEYMSCIYDDFMNYNPSGAYINDDGTVTVSAEIFSTVEPYSTFIP